MFTVAVLPQRGHSHGEVFDVMLLILSRGAEPT